MKQSDADKIADTATDAENDIKSKEIEGIMKTTGMSSEQAKNEQKLNDVFSTAD